MNELLIKTIEAQEVFDDIAHLSFDTNREIRAAFIDVGGAFETLINAINKALVERKG